MIKQTIATLALTLFTACNYNPHSRQPEQTLEMPTLDNESKCYKFESDSGLLYGCHEEALSCYPLATEGLPEEEMMDCIDYSSGRCD